ncbi:hypothetical protein N7447_007302 [Penicillium robsamsonii]|uniref:uncharacterized protein n=1 Tax=Penicillium robsamsonii TaxID=1792511 RepID=UPI0025485CFB|nr:uncharacterized protein N7447_007302 [Penicillium robsamsonii]KAJ5824962.1 hypothetical protein N7447_007302 [Penicillium robsamsonii]
MPALRSSSQDYARQMPTNASIVHSKRSSTRSIPSVSNKSGLGYTSQSRHVSKCHSTSNSSPPAANIAPAEILLEIFSMLTPRDFDNARRTCSQWMRISLNYKLLENMLKRAGWWDAWLQDCKTPRISRLDESEVWRMSRRFATECLLSGRKLNVEKPGFLTTAVVDFSCLSGSAGRKSRRTQLQPVLQTEGKRSMSTFSISSCNNYLLVTTGCMIYIYSLLRGKSRPTSAKDFSNIDLTLVSRISCPFNIISAVIDTSQPQFTIAALLCNRVGMICKLDMAWVKAPVTKGSHFNTKMAPSSRHFFYNVCTVDNPPRTVAICPGQPVLAFGCAAGIEIHSVNETKRNEQRRYFTVPQPSEILHFLPSSPETPSELRLISSLSGPGVHECKCPPSPSSSTSSPKLDPKNNQFHFLADIQSFNRRRIPHAPSRNFMRATHCHHYRAVPINDGFHIMFIEPRTSLLCIGTDAPIGGPTSLTRAFVCVPPPFSNTQTRQTKTPPPSPSLSNTIPPPKDLPIPTTFTSGSDLRWGLRVVAAYGDRLVLYSIPLDVFNMIRKERERQGDGVLGDSDFAPGWYVDSERTRKQRESLVQNQNGEWEFAMSVSYRPTAMMWPFKIYGKEIGSVKGTVELALQSSEGGVRVWAFGQDGKATVLDIDTGDVPTRSFGVGSDGGLEDLGIVQRSLGGSRKRKFEEARTGFVGYGAGRYMGDEIKPCAAGVHGVHHPSVRRSSFAACIIDFKIPLY